MAGEIKFEIVEEIGVLSENAKGWRKELNKVSWNGAAPKYDIRDWAPNHEKMGKGCTLTEEEAKALKALLQEHICLTGSGKEKCGVEEITKEYQ